VLVLVRHGETEGNAARQLLGRAESPLTARGRSDATALGAALGPVSRLVSSPLGRARHTAEALDWTCPSRSTNGGSKWTTASSRAAPCGPSPRAVVAVEGRLHVCAPGGESLAEVGVRVRAACDELFGRAGEGARGVGDVVVVSHVSPVKAAVAWALGAGDDMVWRLYLATASMTRIGWGQDGPVLRGYNETVPALRTP